MRRLLPVLLLAATLAAPAPAAAQVSDLALAQRWAPVHYQDTDSSDYDADYLSAVNYDGNWNGLDNWENEPTSPLLGTVSYSVVETSTHWFIVYAFYHPRDWCDNVFCESHENDMEGLLLAIRRDGSTYGKLEGMVTVAHSDFYSFTPAGSPYTNGRESIDGPVLMQSYGGQSRPTTRQEAKGHGLKAWDGAAFPGGDGVVYYPSGTAGIPTSGNDRSVGYQLVDVFATGGLWARRNNAETFASFGTFRGDNGKDNAANAPWGWDDHDDGSDLPRGLLATDPAKLVAAYFNGEGTFSLTYTRNGYR
ncbi:hypothetical protein Lfu02_54710 [Longispora fulva]|uniref:Uncharacterized protein n=1 Tax=Longispora fulva TaxID=619741 RepID=A0A8J7KQL4_9ACTN|nr:hypothetical protein [Longispora fulva]MBG6137547.1 hypothetical protein [Longispora fulva]GIG61099.1 hypothetical protein Lfu02_54710 [Longispora fulva]